MKILYPLEVFFPSQAGGPANSVYWLTKNVRREGIDPVVVASDKGLPEETPRNTWLETEAGRTVYVRTRNLNLPAGQTLRALGAMAGCDIVHPASVFYPAAFLTAIAARIMRKPVVWSVRGELDPAALAHSRSRKRPVLWLVKRLVGRYAVFHSTCDEETGYIRGTFGPGTRVAQIPNYMEVPGRVPAGPRDYFLYIGRIHPKKAIPNLIEAVAGSEAFLSSGMKLKIAGKGKPEFEEELFRLLKEKNLHDRIEFLGQVEGEAKQRLLAGAYFTVMPSHSENFGIVVLESLAQGTPVIASKGSPWSALEQEKIGFWVDNSPDSLRGAVERALALGAAEYEAMASRTRDFVLREFEIGKNYRKWSALYGRIHSGDTLDDLT